jgi:hypothetical protein
MYGLWIISVKPPEYKDDPVLDDAANIDMVNSS